MIQVDRPTVIQILGSLMHQPSLLSDTDKYQLEPTDFSQQIDKLVFSAIYNLFLGGAEKIHAIDIDSYLQMNLYAKELLERNNGLQFLQDCEVYGEPENFQFYYKKLKKINLLRDLQKSGTSIKEFICEDPLDPKYDEINNKFEELTTTDIINKIKGNVATLEGKYNYSNIIEESKASTGIRDLINELKQKPEVGIRLQGEIFNTITRGGRKGKFYLMSAGSGIGKCIPDYTAIPTLTGWKTVKEIKVGDYLFDRKGQPTKVLGVYPQAEKKQVYKVYFKSGRIAECCEDHLWSYYSNLNDRNPNKLITSSLKELINNPKGLVNNKGHYRWSIPICKPVEYSQKEYSVDPYVMGLILGDGSFRYSSANKGFCFSSVDEELPLAIQQRMHFSLIKKVSTKNYGWMFEDTKLEHKNVWVEDILKEYPNLWQLKSEDKFIPVDFLMGSVQQRFDLLAGLLDTDGSIDEKGRVSFTTISPLLRDNIISLCESLGLICTYLIDKRDKYTTGEAYTIHIQGDKVSKTKMFKLKRKLQIALNYANNEKRTERRDRDSIIKIEPQNNFVNMTCFYVDNDEHLFLMNNYICTHNTRSMVGHACNIAYPIRYDTRIERWVATGTPEKVLYIMTEQDPSEIQTMILAYLTGYNEDMFLYGTYKEEHMERIMKAVEIMEKYENNMLFARIPDPCSSVIKNLFRRYNLQYNVENFFYDYIFSSPAMLEEYRDLKIREDVALRLLTTTIKNLAVELDSFVMSATQISNDNSDGGFKDFRNIRGSKSIADLVDFACIKRRPSNDEMKLVQGYEKNYNLTPNSIVDVYKNRRGRWTMVSIWQYSDLGTLRTYDLFITTSDLKPIEDFQIINFVEPFSDELQELEKNYNKELIEMVDLENPSELPKLPTSLAAEVEKAFNEVEHKKERVKNMSFSDLI